MLLGDSHRDADLWSRFSAEQRFCSWVCWHMPGSPVSMSSRPAWSSSRTTRESYIVRLCLQKHTDSKNKKRQKKKRISEFSSSLSPSGPSLLSGPQQCSSFVAIILVDCYTDGLTVGTGDTHPLTLVPSVGVHRALICKYHHALHVVESELGNTSAQRRLRACPKTCRPRVHMLLLIPQ